jgi:GNAT superfamily N-acetyltransferase
MTEWIVEALRPDYHDASSFCCGKPSLDDFVQKYAGQYQDRNMGRTYVATLPGEKPIRGYHTLAAGSVAFANFPVAVAKKLPRHPIPVAHLGRLAVDQTSRGQRLGETLLLDALKRCHMASQAMGIFAVEVHAIDDEARNFYLHYGFKPLVDDLLHLYLSMKDVSNLFP